MSLDLPMDENLRGLLAELAEQPERAQLGTRVRSFDELLRPNVEVLRPTTGMGVVEAKLLEAYREELAHLLLLASRLRFDSLGTPVLTPRDVDGRVRPLDRDDLTSRVAAIISSRFSTTHSAETLESLKRATKGKPIPLPTPTELAVASLRLVPRSETRIWLGVYYQFNGDAMRSIDMQKSALALSPGGFLASYAWNNVAASQMTLGRYHDATEAGRTASLMDSCVKRSPLTWFVASIQAGDMREFASAADMVSALVTEHSPELHEQIKFMRVTRSAGSWQPSKDSQRLLASKDARLSAAAEAVVEAFH